MHKCMHAREYARCPPPSAPLPAPAACWSPPPGPLPRPRRRPPTAHGPSAPKCPIPLTPQSAPPKSALRQPYPVLTLPASTMHSAARRPRKLPGLLQQEGAASRNCLSPSRTSLTEYSRKSRGIGPGSGGRGPRGGQAEAATSRTEIRLRRAGFGALSSRV